MFASLCNQNTEYTDTCVRCGKKFTVENICWADNGYRKDGHHKGGICENCYRVMVIDKKIDEEEWKKADYNYY
jgi:hypothetical protein